MLKSHEKFHSTNGKRLILIAEDSLINREILTGMLEDEYELIYAEDGAQAMEKIREYKDTLSLVLLDIMMPVMTGIEVLTEVRKEPELSRIPIIVTTAEKETEIESLNLGAIDFIPKPYPQVGVIRARILRTIELSEDREIIQSTERDELTGLYNREYFYKYAEQYDNYHADTEMDAVIVDIDHFHMINERYGRSYGDSVLRKVGELIREKVGDKGGIVCRREADTFMAYCPHRNDYSEIMDFVTAGMLEEVSASNRVRLRMGVYSDVDKELDIERRFDRAKMAADRVKGSFTRNIGIYNNSLHEQQIYAEQLIEDFPVAIREKQFKVFYQPKFDVRPDTPVLSSAESLVRWMHPELGLISPGVFIPLFEDNGLIEKLDKYVWEETARQIREWKDKLNYAIPISVNVSRIDMFDPELPETIRGILKEHNLTGQDLLLEVTESAYTQDSEQIIEMVEKLRKMGLKIEMDDFGTGYSSLNMISSLPIDALKLDMQFIRSAFREGGNTHMLEVIISIADYLSVPVIAEGVETEDQLHALKELGCDIVQGYFFSKPVPASEFEPFIRQKKEADLAEFERPLAEKEEEQTHEEPQVYAGEDKLEPIVIPEEQSKNGIQLRTAAVFSVILAIIAAAALMIADISVTNSYEKMADASDRYIAAQLAASDLQAGSDYLTDRVRCYVVTGDAKYLEDFYEEINVTKRRDNAVENMSNLLEGKYPEAVESLNNALNLSNELVGIENRAIKLVADANNYDLRAVNEDLAALSLNSNEAALTAGEKKALAEELVFDNNYMHYKDRIKENVDLCTQDLIKSSSQELDLASSQLSQLLNIQTALTVILLLIVLAIVSIIVLLIRRPLTHMVKKMQNQETIEPKGVEELQIVTRVYNQILKENKEAREKLSHAASHDALTGLFNRGAYDLLMESADRDHMALLLIDVDYFKEVNDTYGHAVGDKILRKVAEILKESFRSVDILCRIGGDEFAVVMTRVSSEMSQLVINKISRANDILRNPDDDLPPVSLSVGVAFSDRENPQGDIFHDADTALYRVKKAGRSGCAIY
ncbi:MAG: EAL domain-containing protein [Mogibacterium sp.]|nr:EAL domain-containing protein [Mogibacterium sp.]